LERWEARYLCHGDLPPESLGMEDPALLQELGERIHRQKRLYAFLKLPTLWPAEDATDVPAIPVRAGQPPRPAAPEEGDSGPGGARPQADPQLIGRYRVKERLGQGAYGRVYLAHDADLDRDVAIKVPLEAHGARFLDVEGYIKEARILA